MIENCVEKQQTSMSSNHTRTSWVRKMDSVGEKGKESIGGGPLPERDCGTMSVLCIWLHQDVSEYDMVIVSHEGTGENKISISASHYLHLEYAK